MTPGEYEVIAMADGYEPLAKLIEVSEHGHSGTNIFFGYFLGVLSHTIAWTQAMKCGFRINLYNFDLSCSAAC